MIEKLKSIVDAAPPKKISQMVKRDAILYSWVMSHPGHTISERIYQILNDNSGVCARGMKMKFASINLGYKFCGAAKNCPCARESVSTNVSLTKSKKTTAERQATNEKRIQTNLDRYGITNTGGLEKSKLAHKDTYSDVQRVEEINLRVKTTKQQRYNNGNFNNAPAIKETFRKKRQQGFWIGKFPEKNISVLEDPLQLTDLWQKYNPSEIATQLNVHIQTVYRYLNKHGIRQPWKSADEEDVVRFLHSLGIKNIVRNTRKLLPSGKELDIFLPDHNIAIEYNGVYWHHEDVAHITRDYHYNKHKECQQLGIQLITVFSNFWHSKRNIVENILRMKLGCYTGDSIPARKCSIDSVTSKQAKQFLEQNHIQGYTPSSSRLGLYFENRLVAVMTFSKNRIGIGSKGPHTELVRYATATSVPGGAGRLLAAYRKSHPDESIVSYSNNEWSTGQLYKTLRFRLDREIKHSYWYLRPNEHKLYHRLTYSKQKLIQQGHDPAKSESEITRSLGLLKVWDCGKLRWILD